MQAGRRRAPPPTTDDYGPLSEPHRISTAPDALVGGADRPSAPPSTMRDVPVDAIVEARAGSFEERIAPVPVETKKDRLMVWIVLAILVALGAAGAIWGATR